MELLFEGFFYGFFELLFNLGIETFENKKYSKLRNIFYKSLTSKNYKQFLFNNIANSSENEVEPEFSLINASTKRFEIIVELDSITIFPFYINKGQYKYERPFIIAQVKPKRPLQHYHYYFAKPIYFRVRKSMKGRADLFLVQADNLEYKQELSFMNLSKEDIIQLTIIFENNNLQDANL